MNDDLGKPIAYGRTAEIYAWQKDQVLKLFYDWYNLDSIEYEARIGRAVCASGIPAPAVGDIVHVNNRYGLLFQRIDGIPLSAALGREPWRGKYYAQRMAELHAGMHNSTVQVDIPSQRQRLIDKINDAAALPDELRSKALAALEKMPDGNRLCHGDFHPDNILVTPEGELIIDWTDATLGNPLSDLARTIILANGSIETRKNASIFEKFFERLLFRGYVHHYFRLRPGGEQEFKGWLPIVAAARLNENIPELEKWLLAQAGKG